ncbi:MAG TPA: hypothetical protein VFF13_04110 [archaeon]|nr:hypothetical protein [archaeon]
MKAFSNWRVILMGVVIAISLLSIVFNGIALGVDFNGGTIFQIELDESVTPEQMTTITAVMGERIDAFGLKDTKVTSLGDKFVSAQTAETDPERVEELESLLKTQGKFEATLNGEILFAGKDIIQVFKDPAQGYGLTTGSPGQPVQWQLPFLLSQSAGEKFSHGVFHKCTAVSFNQQSGSVYDCEKTYFFIDRPSQSVLIIPESTFSKDSSMLLAGNVLENVPSETDIDELLVNANLPFVVVSGTGFSESQLTQLTNLFSENPTAIIPENFPTAQTQELEEIGFTIKEIPQASPTIPWVWSIVGARQVISVTPGIANLDPYVESPANAHIFSQLVITGSGSNEENALHELKALEVLLQTGSLPVGIKSISKETISPLLGEEFLFNTLIIGLAGLVVVSLIIYLRYRISKLVLPILLTGISEIIITLGLISILKINLDLASVAGILAAVGTGVDDQIIITDELLKGEVATSDTLKNRSKKAFFIIVATASTAIVTMLPILLLSFGFGKLRGFALTTILGILIGIIITRPAFSVFLQELLKGEQKTESKS